MKLSNSVYDRLKWLVAIVLPAIATLYLALDQIWDLPAAEKVSASILVVITFLGAVLGISTKAYNAAEANQEPAYDGKLIVENTPEKKTITIDVGDMDPYEIENMASVLLKVTSPSHE